MALIKVAAGGMVFDGANTRDINRSIVGILIKPTTETKVYSSVHLFLHQPHPPTYSPCRSQAVDADDDEDTGGRM